MTRPQGGLSRRHFMQGTTAGAVALAAPGIVRAQDATIKIGYIGSLSGRFCAGGTTLNSIASGGVRHFLKRPSC